jgi:hypothetical protein
MKTLHKLLIRNPPNLMRWCAVVGIGLLSLPVAASESAEELAKKLSNPVASLISVPFQLNYDPNTGPQRGGERFTLNVQPVIPFSLNEDWNLISRTIVPIISQDNIARGSGSQSGVGDIVQSVFFSPARPTASGLIWGAGPVFLLPTATDDLLGADKWGLGPTGVVLKQAGPWTYGALANHIWSVSGNRNRADISSTFLQPFISYTTKDAWSYSLNFESTYDWKGEQWNLPLNGVISKVTRVGGQLVSFGGGVRYYLDSADTGPKGWGFRLVVTLLFPK